MKTKQFATMRKLFVAVLILLPILAQAQTHVYFSLPEFNAIPATNRTITLQKLTPIRGNLDTYTTGTNNYFYASNLTIGDFDCVILQRGTAESIPFQITVLDNDLGVVNATNITSVRGVQTYPTSGKSAWTIQAAENRFGGGAIPDGSISTNKINPTFRNWVSSQGSDKILMDYGTGTNNDLTSPTVRDAQGATVFTTAADANSSLFQLKTHAVNAIYGRWNSDGTGFLNFYDPADGVRSVVLTNHQLQALFGFVGAHIGDGSALTNIPGSGLQSGSVNSNRFDAATLALLGTGGGGGGPAGALTNNETRAVVILNTLDATALRSSLVHATNNNLQLNAGAAVAAGLAIDESAGTVSVQGRLVATSADLESPTIRNPLSSATDGVMLGIATTGAGANSNVVTASGFGWTSAGGLYGNGRDLTNFLYGPVTIAGTGLTITTNTIAATGQKTYTLTTSGTNSVNVTNVFLRSTAGSLTTITTNALTDWTLNTDASAITNIANGVGTVVSNGVVTAYGAADTVVSNGLSARLIATNTALLTAATNAAIGQGTVVSNGAVSFAVTTTNKLDTDLRTVITAATNKLDTDITARSYATTTQLTSATNNLDAAKLTVNTVPAARMATNAYPASMLSTNGGVAGQFLAISNNVVIWTNAPSGGGGTTYTNNTSGLPGVIAGSGIGTNLTVVSNIVTAATNKLNTDLTTAYTSADTSMSNSLYNAIGATQTTWVQDVNGGGFSLTNINNLSATGSLSLGTLTATNVYFLKTNFFAFMDSNGQIQGTNNGATLTNLNGANIQTATINSNKLDAATVAMFGGSAAAQYTTNTANWKFWNDSSLYYASSEDEHALLSSNDFSGLLQNVLNQHLTAGYSLRVDFASSTSGNTSYPYVVSNTVYITNGVIFVGQGNASTIFQPKAGMTTPMFQIGANGQFLSGITRMHNIRFEGANGAAGNVAVKLSNVAEPNFFQCEFNNFKTAGLQFSQTNYNHWSSISDCWFVGGTNATSHDILIDATPANNQELTIVNCQFYDQGGQGITVSNSFKNIKVIGCTFRDGTATSLAAMRFWDGEGFVIANNNFAEFWTGIIPIRFEDRAAATNVNATIIGNIIHNYATGPASMVYVGTNVSGVNLSGNSNPHGNVLANTSLGNVNSYSLDDDGLFLGKNSKIGVGTNAVDATDIATWVNPQGTVILDMATNGTLTISNLSASVITNNSLTASRLVLSDANKKEISAAASGAVPVDADGSATTFAQVNALAPNAGASYIFTNGMSASAQFSNSVRLSALSFGYFTNITAARFVVHTAAGGLTNIGISAASPINQNQTATTAAQISTLFPQPVQTNGMTTAYSNNVSLTAPQAYFTTNVLTGFIPDFAKGYAAATSNNVPVIQLPTGTTGGGKLVETTVVLVYNTGASVTNIVCTSGGLTVKTNGTWNVTNVTSLTYVKYGNVLTNATALPLY